MAAVTREMIQRYQGFDGFISAWRSAMDQATAAGKHHLVLNSMLAILNLSASCATIQDDDSRLWELTDADLEYELDSVAKRMLGNRGV
jgi:hypothetical protein